MSFCSKCGQELSEGAKFCSKCGGAVGTTEVKTESTRKINYEGQIFKCPNCGEVWNSLETKCPNCGYERRGAKSVGAIKEFYEEIEKIQSNPYLTESEKNAKMINKIRYFPIPNTKEDLLEFIAYARARKSCEFYGNVFSEQEREIAGAWAAKYEELYLKAKFSYGSSAEFAELEKIYISDKKAVDGKVNTMVVTSNAGADESKWIPFLLCLFLGFFGVHKFYEKKYGLGILYLLTVGLFYIGWIADIIKYFPKSK